MSLPIVAGIVLAIGVAVMAKSSGLDRDRAYYPVMLIVIAWYYMLFAVMSGSMRAIVLESIPVAAFTAVALFGFRRNLWLVAAGVAAHGVFDTVHGQIITNSGVPGWWPPFCASIDIAIGLYALWQLRSSVSTGSYR
jgi:hypothetical protein